MTGARGQMAWAIAAGAAGAVPLSGTVPVLVVVAVPNRIGIAVAIAARIALRVGGVAFLPDQDELPLEASTSGGGLSPLWTAVAAFAVLAMLGVGALVWRRR